MSLSEAVAKVKEAVFPTIEAVVRPTPTTLTELLENISDVQCTSEEFERGAKSLSATEARTLVTATLHRNLAYSTQLLPIERARELATELVTSAGKEAKFFSNCEVTDEVNGVGGWKFMVTNHTFESVLYCVGEHETALLVAIDED